MTELFAGATIRPVYYEMGTMAKDQRKKYIRAPFDLVIIDGQRFIRPTALGDVTQAISQLGNNDLEAQALWREDIGYHVLEPLVLTESEMGDGADNWKGMNAVSNL